MGACRFCGENAGPLRREHPRCRTRHESGLQDMLQQANRCIEQPGFNEAAMPQSLLEIADGTRITEQEINAVIAASWTRGIGHPSCGLITREEEPQRHRSFREALPPIDGWRRAH